MKLTLKYSILIAAVVVIIGASSCEKGDLLTNRLLVFDALKMEFRNVKFAHNKNCPICGDHPTITSLQTYDLPTCELKQR